MAGRADPSCTVIAVDATNGHCPSLTLRLSSVPPARPSLVTLTICEWRRVAEQIAEAAGALHA